MRKVPYLSGSSRRPLEGTRWLKADHLRANIRASVLKAWSYTRLEDYIQIKTSQGLKK